MSRLRVHRRLSDIALDIVFAVWVLHVLVTGRLLPPEITTLFQQPSPVTVISEPGPVAPPAEEMLESLPET
jgi:hypothetical protein